MRLNAGRRIATKLAFDRFNVSTGQVTAGRAGHKWALGSGIALTSLRQRQGSELKGELVLN